MLDMFAPQASAMPPSDLQNLAGLPILQTSGRYRVVTENVQMNIGRDGTVQVDSTTVYRNLGSVSSGRILLAGTTYPSLVPNSLSILWDKKPVAVPSGSFGVSLSSQGTHSLSVHYVFNLERTGYGKDQYSFQFRLSGVHPVELFSMSFRYEPGSVFGLPTVGPDLGWEVGDRGASIRKENFTPDNRVARISFYANSMRPLSG